MKRAIAFLFGCISTIGIGLAAPQDSGSAKLDSAPIAQAVKAYEGAYNRGDINAIESLWTEEAVYSNRATGVEIQTKKKIVEELKKTISGGKKGTMALTTDSVQFLSPTVAVEHGTASIVRSGEDPEVYIYTAVYVKQGNKWLLDRVTDDAAPVPHPSKQLQVLEWMLGSWNGGSKNAQVHIECNWTANRSFLNRSFTITEGNETFSGTQIIGWDPINKRIRSWTFDQDGTYSEGTWTQRGDAWTILNQGVLPDGSKSGMVNVMTKIDDSTISWKTTDRAAAGKMLPDLGEIVLLKE
ncbi:MAG: YybH family protein [Pirellula sp.]